MVSLRAQDQNHQIITATTSVIIVSSTKELLVRAAYWSAGADKLIIDSFDLLTEISAKEEIILTAAVVVPAGVTKADQIWLGEYDGETEQVTIDQLLPLIVPNKLKLSRGQIISAPVKISHLASGLKIRLTGEVEVIDQLFIPQPMASSLAEITEEAKNSLVSVAGIIVKVNAKSLILADEEAQLKVVMSQGTKDYQLSDEVRVTGMVSLSGKITVLYPVSLEKIATEETLAEADFTPSSSTTTVPLATHKQSVYWLGGLSTALGLGWLLLKLKGIS